MPDKEARLLNELKNQAVKFRRDSGEDARWKENLEWLKGEQMLDKARWKSNTVTNYLFSQVMTIIAIMANRLPQISIRGINPDMQPLGEALERVINRILRRNDFITLQAELLMNSFLSKKGYFKATWDSRMHQGLGDIRIENPDTRGIYLEPHKQTLGDCNYFFEVRNIDKLSLKQMYPKKGDLINQIFRKSAPGEDLGVEFGVNTGEVADNATAEGVSPTSSEAFIWDMASRQDRDMPHVELVTAWFIDESVHEDLEEVNKLNRKIKKQNIDRKEKRQIKKIEKGDRKFPRGRMIVFSGPVRLDDRPNPFPRYPVVEYQNIALPSDPWGMGEIEQAKPLQEMYNIRQNQIYDMLNFNLAPIRLYDGTSGIDPDEIENKPAQWISVMNVQGVRQLDAPRIPAEVFESLAILQRNIETIFGVREVSQGTVPGDVRSGFAIEQLQEAAQVRLRKKTRILEATIRDLARYLTHMIGMFYIPGVHYDEKVDLTGVHPDAFEYNIRAGVNLPGSQLAEAEFDKWLFSQGIVDQKYIIERSQIPNRDELISRMQPIWEQQAQAALPAPAQ